MDWIPIVFITFKVLVLGVGMFFAIKSHHDLGKKKHESRQPLHQPQALAWPQFSPRQAMPSAVNSTVNTSPCLPEGKSYGA